METAERIAEELLDGFNRHYELFRTTSAQAKEAFEAGDWARVQRLVQAADPLLRHARRSST